MRANDSVKNYPSTLRMYTNYTDRTIRKICKEIGPRESASESERKAQERVLEDLKTCSTEAKLEDFKTSKYAFMAWVPIDGILLILATALSLLNIPVGALACAIIAFLCLAFEFLMYKEFLDPIFPKATTCNAVGVKKPTGEVKQRIIFSGHIDSAYEWSFTHWGGKPLFFGGIIYPILGLLYFIVVSIIQMVKLGGVIGEVAGAPDILSWISLAFLPGFIFIMFFCNFKNTVMGCNDNLTGSITSVAVLKFLQDNGITFENTEVVAMTTACEESGLRGAKAYVKAHKEELNAIPTVFFGMDTLKELEHIAIYERDMTGTVKNDPRVCALMKKGAELAGLDVPYSSVWFGASDAAQVSKMGVPAACLAAMDPTGPRYYHTRRDTPEIMERKTLEKSLDICLQSLFIYDEYGLKDNYDDVVVKKVEETAE